jgi:glutamine amidotransferase
VERLEAPVLPHMGWNTVKAAEGSVLFAGIPSDERFYFVHSYGVRRWELEPEGRFKAPMVTWAEHGVPFVAAAENGPLSATQFHPEKSGDVGAQLLKNWLSTLS